ncbi:MAG: hypothetical protein QGI70_16400, partial [Paracoccaceae bacterium]|nr:hypothetical protein [Paracoccaceae bacterium]
MSKSRIIPLAFVIGTIGAGAAFADANHDDNDTATGGVVASDNMGNGVMGQAGQMGGGMMNSTSQMGGGYANSTGAMGGGMNASQMA